MARERFLNGGHETRPSVASAPAIAEGMIGLCEETVQRNDLEQIRAYRGHIYRKEAAASWLRLAQTRRRVAWWHDDRQGATGRSDTAFRKVRSARTVAIALE
jgi:hypothetical protein